MKRDDYPDGSYNDPQAPWNEQPICDCPRCNGTGSIFYKVDEEFNDTEVTKEEYDSLPTMADHGDIQGDIERCPQCDGYGYITDPRFD